MSDLSELLEVLHEPDVPFSSLRARVRVWRHRERARAAFAAQAKRGRGKMFALRGPGGRPPPDPEPVELIEIWRSEPGRVRVEQSGGERDGFFGVRVGEQWWTWSPGRGAVSNATLEDPSSASSGVGSELSALWDPPRLLGALRFEPIGRGTRVGRPVIVSDAWPRPDSEGPWPHSELNQLGAGADHYRLELDAERGLVLAAQAFAAGEPFKSIEVVELDLDHAIDDDVFVFHAPAGEEIRAPGPPRQLLRHISVSEAQAAAPFTLLIPERVPSSWTMECTYVGASDRPPSPPSVNIRYRSNSGHEGVNLHERGAGDDVGHEGEGWEQARAGEYSVEVLARGERSPESQLRLQHEGTSVLMTSDTLSGEQLIGLAATLTPAPRASRV